MVSYASQFRFHAVAHEAVMNEIEQKSFVERIAIEIENLYETDTYHPSD